jgi:hypothetical protein
MIRINLKWAYKLDINFFFKIHKHRFFYEKLNGFLNYVFLVMFLEVFLIFNVYLIVGYLHIIYYGRQYIMYCINKNDLLD